MGSEVHDKVSCEFEMELMIGTQITFLFPLWVHICVRTNLTARIIVYEAQASTSV